MKTISSQKSLILFDQNRSDSNIYALNGVDDIRLFAKPFYESLFTVLAEELKTKQYTSFVKLWAGFSVEVNSIMKKQYTREQIVEAI